MARLTLMAVAMVLSAVSYQLFAQQLRDPTRPPAGLAQEVGGAKGDVSVKRSGLNLQSILIAPDRRSAIIDGQLLRVGQRVSGFKVVSIEEGAVILRGAQGTRRLQLFPEVDKRKSLTARPSATDSPESSDATNPSGFETKRDEG